MSLETLRTLVQIRAGRSGLPEPGRSRRVRFPGKRHRVWAWARSEPALGRTIGWRGTTMMCAPGS